MAVSATPGLANSAQPVYFASAPDSPPVKDDPMKIRSPWLLKSATCLGTFLMRGWMATVRYRFHSVGPDVEPASPRLPERYIYSFWHEAMLLPAYCDTVPHSKV